MARADADALGFADGSFDLVTCRIAPHHFPDPAAFVHEAARVLRARGVFALVDNIVPADPEAARWYNHWERRRDPSHVRCLSLAEWADLAGAAGLEVEATEAADKQIGFEAWCDNLSVPAAVRADLLVDLFAAPPTSAEFLRPEGGDAASTTFILTEGILIARKRAHGAGAGRGHACLLPSQPWAASTRSPKAPG
jgi:SAM-dependent methyltransferase